MNHPTNEEWMDFLYGELGREAKEQLDAHLRVCASCSQKRTEFQQTLRNLDTWKVELPVKPTLAPHWSPVVKWAAAAVLVVTTAFATGRLSKPRLDAALIDAEIRKPLQESIAREVTARVEQEIQLAAQRTLEKLQGELGMRLLQIAAKAEADVTTRKEQLAIALSTLREQDQTLYSALQEIETKRVSDYRNLREDLEKVAVYTDQSLRTAQRQLVQLASFTQNTEE